MSDLWDMGEKLRKLSDELGEVSDKGPWFQFEPQGDITPLEIAELLWRFGFGVDREWLDGVSRGLRRHFVSNPDGPRYQIPGKRQ